MGKYLGFVYPRPPLEKNKKSNKQNNKQTKITTGELQFYFLVSILWFVSILHIEK